MTEGRKTSLILLVASLGLTGLVMWVIFNATIPHVILGGTSVGLFCLYMKERSIRAEAIERLRLNLTTQGLVRAIREGNFGSPPVDNSVDKVENSSEAQSVALPTGIERKMLLE